MKKNFVEFVGTFFLVFTIGMTVLSPGAGDFAPLAISAALMIMIFAGGHISGAHYNPAVTLAVFLRGKCEGRDVLSYWASQLAGAIAAAAIVKFLKPDDVMTRFVAEIASRRLDVVPSLIVESLFTFALAWVVLNVATAKETSGNSFYGLAIGATVLTGAIAVGGISGGAFNPAVAVGICSMGIKAWADIWVYLVANFGAAVLAAVVFKWVHCEKSS